MLSNFINKIKSNTKTKKLLDFCLIAFLALYIFSMPAFSSRPKFYLISYGLIAILGALVVLEYTFYHKMFFDRRLLIIIAFVIEAFIGTAIHSHQFRNWLTIVLLAITLFVFYYAFFTIDNKRLLYIIIALSFFAFGIYFAFYYRHSILKFNLDIPLGYHFDNVNAISTYFSLGSAIFLYLAISFKRKIEWLYFIPCLFMLFVGLFTGSRQYIVTTGAAFIAAIFVGVKKRKWIALVAIVATIALFVLIIQLPQLSSFKDRIIRGISTLFGIGNAKYDPSAIQRTVWPQNGFYIGSHSLLFGYGAEAFSIYSGIGTYSHNTYSEIFCNFGLAGMVLFYFALIYPFILAIKGKDKKNALIYVVVIFYIVKGFFGVYFASKDAYLMIALLFYLTRDIRLGEFVGFKQSRENNNTDCCEVSI